MKLEVITDDQHVSYVMADLSSRRSEILEFSSRGYVRVRYNFLANKKLAQCK